MTLDFFAPFILDDGVIRGRNTDGTPSQEIFSAHTWLNGLQEGIALAELLAHAANSLLESRRIGREIALKTAREHGKYV